MDRSGERGQVTFLGIGLVLVILFVGGVSLDLWRVFSERRALYEQADAAAAAGANGIDVTVYRESGGLVLDPELARRLAVENLMLQADSASVIGQPLVVADVDSVSVRVEGRVEFTLLRIFTVGEPVVVVVEAEARPFRGTGEG